MSIPLQPSAERFQPRDDRVIRVFVSSTFRDMHEDRDYLVKHVFPRFAGCARLVA